MRSYSNASGVGMCIAKSSVTGREERGKRKGRERERERGGRGGGYGDAGSYGSVEECCSGDVAERRWR